MIQNPSFQRKIIYLALIALLLLPLYWIGNPAKGDPDHPDSSKGGKLAQLRLDYNLSQAKLGEIDPASESMNLATLGLKGVAAAILWSKAHEYKKTENWEALVAVVKQMSKLQPHFVSIWEFQSHNLSYNVSVEHNDYRFRYEWVKKGIDFLIQGTHYNRREPRLFSTVGMYVGRKFGTADEREQFRRLFSEDEDFHQLLSRYTPLDTEGRGEHNGKPDNWLAGRLWYLNAYELVETREARVRGEMPHIFYSHAPKSLMAYAEAIEREGYLGEKAEYAWRRGGEHWFDYGNRLVPTSWGENIRLNDLESKEEEVERLSQQLDELVPGAREQIREEKRASLPPEQRELLGTPNEEISDSQEHALLFDARQKMKVTYREIAERAPQEIRAKAFRLADRVATAETTAERIGKYRTNVNFEYWRTRCEVEQLPETVKARRHLYTAKQKLQQVLLEEAREEFERGWDQWAEILDRNPELIEHLLRDDLAPEVRRYQQLLDQLDEELPEDFKLQAILEDHDDSDPAPEDEPAAGAPEEVR